MEGNMSAAKSDPTPIERAGNTGRYLFHAWFVIAASVIMYAALASWIVANVGAATPETVAAGWFMGTLAELYRVSRLY